MPLVGDLVKPLKESLQLFLWGLFGQQFLEKRSQRIGVSGKVVDLFEARTDWNSKPCIPIRTSHNSFLNINV